jgi:hypothetical protein
MMFSRTGVFVGLFAAGGLLLGLVMYRLQSPHLPMMNCFGVIAFASMGASLGCLVCGPLRD